MQTLEEIKRVAMAESPCDLDPCRHTSGDNTSLPRQTIKLVTKEVKEASTSMRRAYPTLSQIEKMETDVLDALQIIDAVKTLFDDHIDLVPLSPKTRNIYLDVRKQVNQFLKDWSLL